MSIPSPTQWGHRPRLCRCKECGESGRRFTYEQWRWHQTRKQRRHNTEQMASQASGSRSAVVAAATSSTARSGPPSSTATPLPAGAAEASSSLSLSPLVSSLTQAGRSRQEPHADERRQTRQQISDTDDEALLASCSAADKDPYQEAEDSPSDNSDAVPPFPDLPAEDVLDDNEDDDSSIDETAEENALISSQDRLALAQAALLDSSSSHADVEPSSVEETITDPLQHQRNRFVMVNYIFVMYLMIFHGLSNTVATLYLSFVLHVLSRFCAFVIEPSALVAPAALSPSSSPPFLTREPQQQPSPSTNIGPESSSQLSSGLIDSVLDSGEHTQPRETSSPSSLPSQPAPLPPPPLSMLVTPASVQQRLGLQSDFDHDKLFYDHSPRPKMLYCHRTLESILSSVLKDDKYYNTLKDWIQVVEEASNTTSPSSMPTTALRQDDLLCRPSSTCAETGGHPRLYSEVATGSAWLEDCGDSAEDCRRQCQRNHAPFVAAGLNLKVTLSVDWFGPQKGKFHEWHSTGAILLRIDNLPARSTTHDRRCLGTHLVGLLPGPKESSAARLQKFLKLVVDELKDFSLNGKVIKTHVRPEGELVKARLHMIVADTPARAKVAGFALKYRKGTICAYCPKQGEKLGLTDDEEDEEDSFVGSQRRRTRQRTAAGFRRVAIDELSYFSAVDSCPPDMMHALHLGLCKRFWHRFLIESCNEIGLRLPEAQHVIANALLPSNVQRPNKLIGSRSGGNPTAEQWETLFRVLLPFVLMQLWSESLGGRDDEELNFALVKPGGPRTRPLAPQSASQAANPTVHISTTAANTSSVIDATAATAATTPSSLPPPLTSHQNSSSTSSLVDNIEYQPPPGADVDVHLYEEELDVCDAPARADGEPNGRRYLPGPKRVRSVFRSAMLLCSIVEMTSGDLDSAEVNKLADYIKRYNRSQAKLLGPAWLTFNNHNLSHLPQFIKRFGSPRHFSSLPFERFNGLMGTIPTSGHKGGMLEATIMRNMAQRLELRRLLSESDEPFFSTRLLESIEGLNALDLSSLDTRLKKKHMDDNTCALLLNHLNRRAAAPTIPANASADATSSPSRPLRYTPFWDIASSSDVAHLNNVAEFTRTATVRRGSGTIKFGGVGQGGRDNRSNCWCLVSIDGVLKPAKILWIFSKEIRHSAMALDMVTQTFIHVRLLLEVSLDMLGRDHPCRSLLDGMGIRLAIDNGGEYGEEVVVDLDSFRYQLAVVPFTSNGQRLLGLKTLM
ncbi:uncharacterized protein UTRI_04617 [Ustilago trichophora]|uniref:Uncharacterized protein n=1 Tax=Ustilago trichophora TaxID=86804 RepID=A0A5C3EHQ4_9BASI|nr:uncharacterized protein UTRI_04617 [Ustilago trichophora]